MVALDPLEQLRDGAPVNRLDSLPVQRPRVLHQMPRHLDHERGLRRCLALEECRDEAAEGVGGLFAGSAFSWAGSPPRRTEVMIFWAAAGRRRRRPQRVAERHLARFAVDGILRPERAPLARTRRPKPGNSESQ